MFQVDTSTWKEQTIIIGKLTIFFLDNVTSQLKYYLNQWVYDKAAEVIHRNNLIIRQVKRNCYLAYIMVGREHRLLNPEPLICAFISLLFPFIFNTFLALESNGATHSAKWKIGQVSQGTFCIPDTRIRIFLFPSC